MPKANFVSKREAALDDSDDDELEELDLNAAYQKDIVLFCIDAGASMHAVNPASGTSNLYIALKAAAGLMEKKLISSPHDHIGVMLFNTNETLFKSVPPGEYYKGSYELQTIRQVNVPDTFNLKSLLKEAEQDPDHLAGLVPPRDKQMRIDWALANAGVAMAAAANAGTKRVFFITDNDDPHPLNDDAKSTKALRSSLQKMAEFRKIGVRIETFFIGTNEKPFQINKFYSDIFEQYDDEDDVEGPRVPRGFHPATEDLKGQEPRRHLWDSAIRFQELENDVSTRETPKRVIFSIRFELGTLNATLDESTSAQPTGGNARSRKWQIGIKGYSLISKTTKGNPAKVIVDDDCGELKEVVTHQHYVDPITEKPLSKDQVIPAFQFGQNTSLRGQVRFTPNELKRLKSMGLYPSLKLLGFKDRSELKFQDNVKHAYFIYPSDAEWRGSKKVFAALLDSMLRKDKIGLGLFMPRQNTMPSFVAILPQPEEVADGQQIQPPGMHLIILPYADDVRDVPEAVQTTETALDSQVDAAKAVIERFQKKLPFNPDHYPNPALNHHYAVLKATAFQEELPEAVEDYTVPQYASIKKRTAHLIQAFNDEIEQDDRAKQPAQAVKTSTNTRKSEFENDDMIVKLWRDGRLSAYTVEELRAACDFYRIDKKGRKAELVARIEDHLANSKR
ncbi:ATP-dependent DNA helicase II subunit 1 [Thecaphora frezii]